MIIKFKSLRIHHFLSFDDVEISLVDKGYCLVSGINNCQKDGAKSNGAGKSTIFSAISYALTGETLQGIKTGLANEYFKDGCYVKLDFDVDGHSYSLLRSKDDKEFGTNLKIIVDGEDKSGKGIRESNERLSEYLPDLTRELIGSIIMIGQGMPMRFTSNSPSGRKEVLEQLSQSNFMIADLKERVSNRYDKLSNALREVEDTLLVNKSKSEVISSQLANTKNEYETKYVTTPTFDNDINNLTIELKKLHEDHDKVNVELQGLREVESECNKQLLVKVETKKGIEQKLNSTRSEYQEQYTSTKANLVGKKTSLEQEIRRLKSITDVCPTCGQKIPGAIKPDTTKQEQELQEICKQLENLELENKEDSEEYFSQLKNLDNMFKERTQEISNKLQETSSAIQKKSQESFNLNATILNDESKLVTLKKDKENFETNKNVTLERIKEFESTLKTLDENKIEKDKERTSILEHLAVNSKMSTLLKRDFRGFLLKSVIEYVENKSKEYALKIFGCDEIAFTLSGNDIDISFCNKDYDNLSGGEKQRVDLIIQFAIRDFMSNYLQFSSNILVLDEITDALDSVSCDRVLDFITSELSDIESVFIISHHSDELDIPVDSEIRIEKNELGVSHVVY